jgi:hypothetical protein
VLNDLPSELFANQFQSSTCSAVQAVWVEVVPVGEASPLHKAAAAVVVGTPSGEVGCLEAVAAEAISTQAASLSKPTYPQARLDNGYFPSGLLILFMLILPTRSCANLSKPTLFGVGYYGCTRELSCDGGCF